jgi:hypothetical protein
MIGRMTMSKWMVTLIAGVVTKIFEATSEDDALDQFTDWFRDNRPVKTLESLTATLIEPDIVFVDDKDDDLWEDIDTWIA